MSSMQPTVHGFTLIELLLVIALIGIVAVSTTPLISTTVGANILVSTQQNTLGYLRKAQQYAMDNRSNAPWGVCVTSGTLRLFQGTCGAPVTQQDVVIPATASVSGLTTITFSSRGEPSTAGTITISTQTKSQEITLTSAGGIYAGTVLP